MADNKETEIKVKVDSTQAAKSLNDLKKEWLAAEKAANSAAIGTKEYAKAQEEAAGKKNAYEGAKKDAAELRKENGNLVESFGKFTPASGIIGDLSAKFNQAKASVISLGSTVFTLSGALIAIPIVALVAGFTALFTYFTKTDEGAVKLESITRALSATFDVLIGRVARAGEGLFKLLTGDFQGAAKAVEGLFTGIGDEIAVAASEASSLAKEFDKLDDQQRTLAISNAENEKQITQLLLQSKNRAKSEEERLDLLDKASAIETRNFLEKKAYAEAELAAIERENALAIKSGTIQDEARQKATDARVRLINLEQESINLQEKIENRRSALLDAQGADREKNQKAIEKAEADRLKAIEATLKAAEQFEKDYVDYKNNLILDSFDREAAIRLTEYDRQRTQLQEKGLLDAETIKAIDAQLAFDLDAIEEARKLDRLTKKTAELDEQNALQIAKQEELFLTAGQSHEAFEEAKRQSQLLTINQKLALLEAAGKAETSQYQKLKNEALKIDKEILASKQSSLKAQALAVSQTVSQSTTYVTNFAAAAIALSNQESNQKISNAEKTKNEQITKLKEQLDKGLIDKTSYDTQLKGLEDKFRKEKNIELRKQFEAEKALKQGQAVISGALAVIQALAQLGPIAGAIAAVAIGITTGVQLAVIGQQKPPTFRGGGIVRGSSHGANYGDSGIALIDRVSGREVGEMENEEIIMTAGVKRDPVLLAAASRLNVKGGGRAFAEGGVVDTNTTSTLAQNQSQDSTAMEVRQLRQEINNWQKSFKVNLVYSEFEAFEEKVNLVQK